MQRQKPKEWNEMIVMLTGRGRATVWAWKAPADMSLPRHMPQKPVAHAHARTVAPTDTPPKCTLCTGERGTLLLSFEAGRLSRCACSLYTRISPMSWYSDRAAQAPFGEIAYRPEDCAAPFSNNNPEFAILANQEALARHQVTLAHKMDPHAVANRVHAAAAMADAAAKQAGTAAEITSAAAPLMAELQEIKRQLEVIEARQHKQRSCDCVVS